MDQELLEIHQEIEDELIHLFNRIISESPECSEEDDNYHLRYRGTNEIYGERESGTIIIGAEDNDQVSYAYRMRFNSSENKPKRKYWYSEEHGLKSISVILGEKDHIMGVLDNCYKREDLVSKEEFEYIENLFSELRNRRETVRELYDLNDVSNRVLNNDRGILQDIVAPDNKSSVEIWKLLFSRGSDGNIVDNDVEVPFKNENMILARTERTYHSSDGMRSYPFGLIIGKDRLTGEFYVHRIKRNEIIEKENYNWDLKDIKKTLGYDRHICNTSIDKIDTESRTRLAPNLVLIPFNYKKEFRKYRNYVFDSVKQMMRYLYFDYYKDIKNIDLSPYNVSITSRDGLVNNGATTDELKSVQDELNICESRVRELQYKRDIGRLSSGLRAEILRDLVDEDIFRWVVNIPSSKIRQYQVEYEEEKDHAFGKYVPSHVMSCNKNYIKDMVSDPYSYELRSIYDLCNKITRDKFRDNQRDIWVDRGANKFKFCDAKRHPRHMGVNGFDFDKIEMLVISEDSEVVHRFSDGCSRTLDIKKGVYKVNELKTTRTRHFQS